MRRFSAQNLHHVESDGHFFDIFYVMRGDVVVLFLFSIIDRLNGRAEIGIRPRLYLDKDDIFSVLRDDIRLSVTATVVARKNAIALLFEHFYGERFPVSA